MRRESDQCRAQTLDFGVSRRKRLQLENTKGTPIAPEEADNRRPAFKKTRKVDETTASASEPEQGCPLAGLYGLGDEARFGERLDRAPARHRPHVARRLPRIRKGMLRAAPSDAPPHADRGGPELL